MTDKEVLFLAVARRSDRVVVAHLANASPKTRVAGGATTFLDNIKVGEARAVGKRIGGGGRGGGRGGGYSNRRDRPSVGSPTCPSRGLVAPLTPPFA